MNSKNLILFLVLAIFSGNIMSHEGHNHDAPKTLSPLKGGSIKTFMVEGSNGKKDVNCFVEVAKLGKMGLKIYFFDKDQKLVNPKDFTLEASVIPFISGKKNEKAEVIEVKVEKEKDGKDKMYYESSYDKKNSHKYDLVLKFKGPDYCKTNEEITFIID